MIRRDKKTIVIFGGSFNPPHKGHGEVLVHLATLPQFHEVWVTPSFAHPFLKSLIPFSHRLKLCQLMVGDIQNAALFKKDLALKKKLKVSSAERKIGQKPVYTIDLIRHLKKRYPGVKWVFALGSDCQKDLPRWKNYKSLVKLVDFHFIPRAGFEKSPFLDISATKLREMISCNKNVTRYVSPKVLKYIKTHQLYENSSRP